MTLFDQGLAGTTAQGAIQGAGVGTAVGQPVLGAAAMGTANLAQGVANNTSWFNGQERTVFKSCMTGRGYKIVDPS